ncbi:flagellar biosynthetic protein FlhB [Paracoccus isoporae]|uniref:Flagellar biosynthetic protein FlhB n=1 Tax=Paracoccus isoporae TaxID=591205 RepID=A0A1G6Z832_9RHOB|nr:EscU/YscU/HrcU family type III secretion system export apparatus switch protein [Paracoccus isoporae]SDD98035.1 flagellar biosynthetic protein FlhB [Paracoccus isoporae]
MSDSDAPDKQFEATEQKLRKARQKGDVPRSTEVNAALAYAGALIAAFLALNLIVPAWLTAVAQLWSEMSGTAAGHAGSFAAHGTEGSTMRVWRGSAIWTLALLSIPAAIMLCGLIVQRGLVFVPSKLGIKPARINPVQNAGQKFGRSGLVSFALNTSKTFAVGFGGWLLFRALIPVMTAGGAETGWVAGIGPVVMRALALALLLSALFAVADLVAKHAEFWRRNRMSMQEMRDEIKESEGDPHMKAARRERSVAIVLNAMLADVEKADVVVVNPTHYAVALEWKRGSGRAPVCLAKGVDAVALRIRERAAAHEVPIWPDPACARAMHATVEIGEEIAPAHFAAVAAAIRFAERMREKARRGW